MEVKSDRRDGGVVIIKIKMNLNAEEVNAQKGQTLCLLKQTKCLLMEQIKYTFCLDCGEFDSILLDNTTMFKKK
ncbi:hypothetical protein MHH96_11295 [Niallia sp. FSL K6-0212]|uniref:hypothetical protein n=1 Tax=Niallia sp. FSL K6-0212 TaxID=2921423 RepID=UPI0030FB66EE